MYTLARIIHYTYTAPNFHVFPILALEEIKKETIYRKMRYAHRFCDKNGAVYKLQKGWIDRRHSN